MEEEINERTYRNISEYWKNPLPREKEREEEWKKGLNMPKTKNKRPLSPYGELIKKIRRKRGIKLKDQAKHLRLSPQYICGLERGRHQISPQLLQKIIDFLGVSEKEEKNIKKTVQSSAKFVKIDLRSKDSLLKREVSFLFSTKIKSLDLSKLEKIKEILTSN
jgi:transcriptional regulator with XRE-family HTH domain